MKDIEVGQEVYVVPTVNLIRIYGKQTRTAKVTKVGRVYFYIEIDGIYGEERINKKSMRGSSVINSDWLVFRTMQEIEDRKEKARLHDELRQFFSWGGKSGELTLEQLRGIKAIVEDKAQCING